ncbi:hypothetical protein ACH5RR_033915 [Cinchona calisaya]|uniref:Uncharacterized protein n=1 Tax=Cinchona calisaya TaxID=153742 RepID=A0ABD2Y9D5_9GENT
MIPSIEVHSYICMRSSSGRDKTTYQKRSYDPIDYESIDKTEFWMVEEEPNEELDYDQLEAELEELLVNDVVECSNSQKVGASQNTFKDEKGNVFYTFAMFKRFWPIDRKVIISLEEAAKRKIGPFDFLQPLLSMLVFATIDLVDLNTVNCFYPTPSVEMKEILSALPVANGVVCSLSFVAFPTQRHGIRLGRREGDAIAHPRVNVASPLRLGVDPSKQQS